MRRAGIQDSRRERRVVLDQILSVLELAFGYLEAVLELGSWGVLIAMCVMELSRNPILSLVSIDCHAGGAVDVAVVIFVTPLPVGEGNLASRLPSYSRSGTGLCGQREGIASYGSFLCEACCCSESVIVDRYLEVSIVENDYTIVLQFLSALRFLPRGPVRNIASIQLLRLPTSAHLRYRTSDRGIVSVSSARGGAERHNFVRLRHRR